MSASPVTVRDAIAFQLGRGAGERVPAMPATVDTPVPEPIRVGEGTVLFLGGRTASGVSGREIELLLDGTPLKERPTVVRPGLDGPSFWWAAIALPADRAPDRLSLAVRTSAKAAAVELCELVLERRPEPPTGCLAQRLDAAVSAAATGGPLVAIAMATHEPDPGLFAAQVESIRNQTHRSWICIVCDDASGPRRLEGIQKILGGDSRFVLAENRDRVGFYRNFERALGAIPAEVEFVALADQDDRWHDDKLKLLLAGLGDRDLAYGDMRLVREDGSLIADTYWTGRRNNYTDLCSLLVGNTVTGAASLFRASVLERALPFPPALGNSYHDHWIALVAMTGGGLAYVDRPVQDYVQHSDAALGHAGANAGVDYQRPRLLPLYAWKALRALGGNYEAEKWAARYFGMHMRTTIWARILLMRSVGSLTPRRRRTLERLARADRSPLSVAWLALRSLRPLAGANEAFGREILVLLSSLWMKAARIRTQHQFSVREKGKATSRARA